MFIHKIKDYKASALITLALLMWGWQNNALSPAISLALPLLIAQWVHWRLEISDINFNRIADFTSVLFFLFIVIQFSTKSAHGIFAILAALPYLFYPLILAQYLGQVENIPLHSLFVSMRKKPSDKDEIERINLNYPYLMAVIISASAGLKHGSYFYICIAALAALSLYSIRSRRVKIYTWITLLALSISMGYVIQNGLKIAQSKFEIMASTFIEQMMWRNRDPDKTRIAFGYIGKLKLSDQIHVRVQSNETLIEPLLLREASYTSFKFGLWINDDSWFESVDPTTDKEWIFDESSAATGNTRPEKYTISTYFKGDRGVIPLPHGTYRINNVPATEAELNQFGAVNLGMKPGWVRYDAYFDNEMLGAAPGEADLTIHKNYQSILMKLANELDLYSKTPNEVIQTVEQFFRENFSYSLEQYRSMRGKNRLEDFLYHRREGHCEYFATATTLLLRTVGIPTRYTVGYSIQEYSLLEKQYIARARDAHSWTIAYVGDQWIVLDNTPAVWAPLESAGENWWQPIADLWSWLGYSVSIWRDYSKDQNNFAIQIMLIIVIIYFFWRLFTDSRFIKIRQTTALQKSNMSVPGSDSPLYKLTNLLEERGIKRLNEETLSTWFLRQENNYQQRSLLTLLDLHYRYRFDPVGLTTGELEEFEDHVVRLLDSPYPSRQ